jgi:hypothetical protein
MRSWKNPLSGNREGSQFITAAPSRLTNACTPRSGVRRAWRETGRGNTSAA